MRCPYRDPVLLRQCYLDVDHPGDHALQPAGACFVSSLGVCLSGILSTLLIACQRDWFGV
jgi:hypothetical protein